MSSDPAAPATAQHMPGEPAAGTLSCAPVVLPLVPGFARPPAERRPLPDAVAVRMLAIPDSAPPYDDEVAAGQRPAQASDGPPRGDGLPPGDVPRPGEVPLPGQDRWPAAAGSPARGPAASPGWPSQ